MFELSGPSFDMFLSLAFFATFLSVMELNHIVILPWHKNKSAPLWTDGLIAVALFVVIGSVLGVSLNHLLVGVVGGFFIFLLMSLMLRPSKKKR